MTRPEHYRSYSAVFPILLREGANGREVLLHLRQNTGYITDLGMTGPIESVLGVEPAQSVESFLGGLPGRYRNPEGPCKLQGAIFTLDSATGLCTAVERVDIR